MHLLDVPPIVRGTPEEISGLLFSGRGPLSLDRARSAWMDAFYQVYDLHLQFDQLFDTLDPKWFGFSKEMMAQAREPFREWLLGLCRGINRTFRAVEEFEYASRRARSEVVEPSVIAANREMVSELTAEISALGPYYEFLKKPALEELAELEKQYAEFELQDIEAMEKYRNDVLSAFSKLTAWEPPPSI